jgi:hypothetical protein
MIHRRLLGALLALSAVMGWLPLGAQTTRDSAGVQIVLNERPSLPAAKTWRVAPVPLLSIGAGSPLQAGDSLYEFYLLYGMAKLSDGRIAVGVQSTHTVRIFDAKGKFVSSFGRQGKGPGEFQQIMGVYHTRGDTLAITDLGEIEWYSGAGKFIRPGAGDGRGGARFIWPAAYLENGAYVGVDRNDPTVPPAGRRIEMVTLFVVEADGARRSNLGRVATAEAIYNGKERWGRPVEYAPYGRLASDGKSIYHGYASTYRIDQWTADGKIVRSIRRAFTPVPMSDEVKAAFAKHRLSMPGEDGHQATAEMKALFERNLKLAVFAPTLPAYNALMTDRSGNLWVEQYDPLMALYTPGPARVQTIAKPTRWDVFDRNGRWLTTVELPARFTPQEIGADYVLGVARNEDEEEGVRMYRLVKP